MTSTQLSTLLGLIDTSLAGCGLAKGKFADIKGDGSMYHASGYMVVPTQLNTTGMSAERVSKFELRLRLQLAWACRPSQMSDVISGAIADATAALVAVNGIDWSSSLSPLGVAGSMMTGAGSFEYMPEGILYFSTELPITYRKQRT